MADFTSFYPYVLPDVPDCPTIVIDDAVRDGCRAVSLDTWLVRALLSTSTLASQQAYSVTPPTNHEILAVTTVMYGAAVLYPAHGNAILRMVATSGDPQVFWYDETLYLYPAPDAAKVLQIQAVIRPTSTAASVNDLYYNEYRGAVSAWALSKLMLQTGKPWSNPKMAQVHRSEYARLTGSARIRYAHGGSSALSKVAFRSF